MSVAEKVVCVTGASGFIASWLVKLLLQRGYTVKATVRDPNDARKTQHLFSLDGAKERLHLFKAELVDEGCFDSIVDGCHGVFHAASPVFLSAADPQAEIIGPAIKGTLNVLKSCAKVASIKRVVITSSMSSVVRNGKPLTPDVVVDETWFSDPLLCEEGKLWYMLSKTLAEEAAWRFAKDNGIDLITIHPGMVFGPLLQPALNSSSEVILNLIKGEHSFPSSTCTFVDVRDVAHAHIQAFEDPSACGRYCLVERSVPYSEVQKMLYELYPTLQMNETYEDHNKPPEQTYQVSKEKAKSLVASFIPLVVSLRDSIESLKEKGFLSI
ncbi:tetraketide alpha-pyrone reductase 1-like [Durio zibethinus]|uniref:Tetraketide alpha-pyrone reductase 1-like n=1 Tax=Durio zibethinus TaxID=66656 RepID=A0A6P6AYN1_DURZI|nr:tetraketide alpha-pyrone reductase 1-like [Durio zibethinus]